MVAILARGCAERQHSGLTIRAARLNVTKTLALGVTVARLTLNQLVKVQILKGQLKKNRFGATPVQQLEGTLVSLW